MQVKIPAAFALAAGLVAAALGARGAEPRAADSPALELLFPPEGAVVSGAVCGLFVAGAAGAPPAPRDVVVAIDTSRSTVEASGADIDGDGVLGEPERALQRAGLPVPSTDPDDSILAAEVAAARRIVEGLDLGVDRVGVVAFAGERRGLAFWRRPVSARTLAAPTRDADAVRAALDAIAGAEPRGGTDFASAIDEILSVSGERARGEPEPGGARLVQVYLFTDGQPTLPLGADRLADNVRVSLEAVDRAAGLGVRIDSFGIGREALDGPIVPVEMAERTGGTFTPVRHPGDLADLVGIVAHPGGPGPGPGAVEIRNATTGEVARTAIARGDGRFAAFVDLAEGDNRIEVTAIGADGGRSVRSVGVHRSADAAPTPVPEALRAQRDELLEDCLRATTGKRLSLEAELRDRLVEQIERERRRALERSDEQRKRLKLEVE